MIRRELLLGLTCLPFPAQAQGNPFMGKWRSEVYMVNNMQVQSETTFTAGMEFITTTISSGGYRVDIQGNYSFPQPGILKLVYTKWFPEHIRMPRDENCPFEVRSPNTIILRSFVPGVPVITIHRIG